jgi:hypothetical protein
MSDEVKVEPAKAAKNEVTELKAKLDNLSAYVRKIAKNFEKLSGIDLNADGKIGLIVIGLFCASVAFAADTQVSGYTNETNVGTFYVSTDGTSSQLTVDKLVVKSTATLSGAGLTGAIPVASITNALNQTASAVTNVIVSADAKTNTFIIAPVGQVNVIRSWVVTQ